MRTDTGEIKRGSKDQPTSVDPNINIARYGLLNPTVSDAPKRMDGLRFAEITERQRECLRLYHHRLSVKEIGLTLGLSGNTIENHLTRAARTLRTDRATAAAALFAEEVAGRQPVGRFSASDPKLVELAPLAHVGREKPSTLTAIWSALIPLRRGAKRNELSILDRLIPIPFIAAALAIVLGLVVVALDAISRLIGR